MVLLYFADKVLEHDFSNGEVCDDTFLEWPDRLDISRCAAQHHLGLLPYRQHRFLRSKRTRPDCNNGGLIQDHAPVRHINQRIGGSQVYRQIIGEQAH